MSLIRRVPKHGFTNVFRKEYSIVNLKSLGDMIVSGTITPQARSMSDWSSASRCRSDSWKRRPHEGDRCAGAQVQ